MREFTEDDIKRTGLPEDVFGLLHDLCYHVNNKLRGTLDEDAVQNYVRRAQEILKKPKSSMIFICCNSVCRDKEFKELLEGRVKAVRKSLYSAETESRDINFILENDDVNKVRGLGVDVVKTCGNLSTKAYDLIEYFRRKGTKVLP